MLPKGGWLSCGSGTEITPFPLPETHVAEYKEGDQALLLFPPELPARAISHVLGSMNEAQIESGERSESERALSVRLRIGEAYGVVLVDWLDPFPVEQPTALLDEEFIVFADDDATPLFGCSARLPRSSRPFMLTPTQLASSEIDLAGGRSVIGQVNVEVLDKRTDAQDQNSGWLTAALAQENGFSALVGRRALLRRWIAADGSEPERYHVIMDGVIHSVRLNDDLVTYSLSLRDIRERERKVGGFTRTGTTAIWPRGIFGEFGGLRPVAGARGVFTQHPGPGCGFVEFAPLYDKTQSPWVAPAALAITDKALTAYGEPVVIEEGAPYEHCEERVESDPWQPEYNYTWTECWMVYPRKLAWPNVLAYWRTPAVRDGAGAIVTPAGPWQRLNMRSPYSTDESGPDERGFFTTTLARTKDAGDEVRPHYWGCFVFDDSGAAMPANGSTVEIVYVYNGAPTEDYPLHYEGTAGDLLARCLSGVYGEEGFTPVRFDADAVAAMDEPLRARITKPVDDLREWLEDHLYKPLGYAPALDEQGRISPVKLDRPGALDELPLLSDDVVHADAKWEHSGGDAVNVVEFRYKRLWAVSIADDPLQQKTTGDGLQEREVVVEHRALDSIALLGEKVWKVKPDTFCAIGGPDGVPQTRVEDEEGARRALERRRTLFPAYRWGAQRWSIPCSFGATETLRVGDEVRVQISWLPNYQTGRRGVDTVGVVVGIKDADYATRVLTVEDIGSAVDESNPLAWGLTLNTNGEAEWQTNEDARSALARWGLSDKGTPATDADFGDWIALPAGARSLRYGAAIAPGKRLTIQVQPWSGTTAGTGVRGEVVAAFVDTSTLGISNLVLSRPNGNVGAVKATWELAGDTKTSTIQWAETLLGVAAKEADFRTDPVEPSEGTALAWFAPSRNYGYRVTARVVPFEKYPAGSAGNTSGPAVVAHFEQGYPANEPTVNQFVNDSEPGICDAADAREATKSAWWNYNGDATLPGYEWQLFDGGRMIERGPVEGSGHWWSERAAGLTQRIGAGNVGVIVLKIVRKDDGKVIDERSVPHSWSFKPCPYLAL